MKKLLSIILALTFCLAAFSALAPTVAAADAFTQADAKALVDAASEIRAGLNDYLAKYKAFLLSDEGKEVDDKRVYVNVQYHVEEAEYYPLIEELLPGSSYAAFEKLARESLVETLAERICTKANSYSLSDLIITEDGKQYILPGVTEYFYLPDRSRVELTEVSENAATANVYCVKPEYPRDISICVECKFEKTDAGWRITESPFSDMLTGAVWSIYYTYTESDIPTRELADEFSMIIRDTQYLFLQTQVYGPSGSNEVEIDGYKYSEINGTNRPSDWLEKYKKLAADTYSEDIVDLAFRFNRYDFILDRYIDNAPLFVERDGKVYWYYLAGGHIQFYNLSYAVDYDKEVIFDDLKVNGDRASGYVMCWNTADAPRDSYTLLRRVPVEFVKTADGWRLADCAYFRMFYDPSSFDMKEYYVLDRNLYDRYGIFYDTLYFKDLPPSSEKFDKEKAVKILETAYQLYLKTNYEVPTSSDDIKYYKDSQVGYAILDVSKLYGGSEKAWNAACQDTYSFDAGYAYSRAYFDSNLPLIMWFEGNTRIACGQPQREYFRIPSNGLELEILKREENHVVARVKVIIPGQIVEIDDVEAYVTCVFENTSLGWRLGDCAYTDMLTSTEFEYTPVDNPDTGDRAFDTLALCLGGMAIVMSALCLVRRRREF